MAVYGREDDLVLALKEANYALASNGRFDLISNVENEIAAATMVTKIADVYVAWLRRVKSVTLKLVAIEEDTGEIASIPTEGTVVANIDTSQQARWDVTAKDDRGFAADYALAARASDAEVITVTYLNVGDEGNTSPADAPVDQVLAAFAGKLGTSTVEVFDPAVPDVVLVSGTVVANPGAVASAELGEAVIEEMPEAPAPEPTPEPEPEPTPLPEPTPEP